MITLTDSAANYVKQFMTDSHLLDTIRLGVKRNGCSGLSYVLEFVDVVNDEDTLFEDKGVKIVVDSKSLLSIDGTELDYAKEGLNAGIKFNNPKVKSECGCGESFNV